MSGIESGLQNALDQLSGNSTRLEAVLERMYQALGPRSVQFSLDAAEIMQLVQQNLHSAMQAAQHTAEKLSSFEELARVCILLNASLDLGDVLREVMDAIINLSGAERAYLMLYDQDSREFAIQAARNWDHETLSEDEITFSHGAVKLAMEGAGPILSLDAQTDSRFAGMESVVRYAMRAILCIPLIVREEIVGVIYADNYTRPAIFRPDDLPLLTAFASQAAIAIENARLFERVKADLNRAQREVQRLQIQEATLAPPESVLPTIVETVARVLALPYVAVALKQGNELMITAAAHGTPSGELVHLSLSYQQEKVGELIVAPRAPGESFSALDDYLFHELVHQAGIALHTVRLTADLQQSRQRLVTTREEERRRLRRDLHDGLGPALASIMLKLDAAHNLLTRDPQSVKGLLADLNARVQSVITDIHRVTYDLRPPALDELGLVEAIRQNVANVEGLQVLVEAEEPLPPLSAAVEVAAYRIVLEALTNVTRHAQARHCRIRLMLDRLLELEITDDGCGLPSVHRAGVGLTSMRERAEELGGTCVIESLPAGGTRVLAALPLPSR
jgi:signal transduction histidine kinase